MLPYVLLLFLTNGPMVATVPQQTSDICEGNGKKYTSGRDAIAWKYRCIPTGHVEDQQ